LTVESQDLLAKYALAEGDLNGVVDSKAPPPSTVVFELASGKQFAIAYHQLFSVEYRVEVPATDKGTVTLYFREHTVVVEGMRLKPIFDAVRQLRLAVVRVSDRAAAFSSEKTPVVDAIRLPKRPSS